MSFDQIEAQDPVVAAAMKNELDRQLYKLEMIASENFASPAVLQAAGSVLTHKYAGVTPAAATTAVASLSMWWNKRPSIAPRNCSAPSMPTCSRTPARRPT